MDTRMQARAGFDRELQRLQDEVLVMGSMVENSMCTRTCLLT